MLRLRQYKEADAKKIAQWVQDKDVFQKWGGDLFGEYPIDSETIADMYKNKNGKRNNICGLAIRKYRLQFSPPLSQRGLADRMQLEGIDLDKNAIQRIEAGKRFVTDIELIAFARILGVTLIDLYNS